MNHKLTSFAAALAAVLCTGTAAAQTQLIKLGVTRYTTHSQTNGVTGIGVPPGADAETGDATTAILVYERLVNPNLGIELVVGIPPRIKARATGSVAFLGDDILSAKVLTPSLLANYHFGAPGDTWRPYVGAGINYTRFESIRSRLAFSTLASLSAHELATTRSLCTMDTSTVERSSTVYSRATARRTAV